MPFLQGPRKSKSVNPREVLTTKVSYKSAISKIKSGSIKHITISPKPAPKPQAKIPPPTKLSKKALESTSAKIQFNKTVKPRPSLLSELKYRNAKEIKQLITDYKVSPHKQYSQVYARMHPENRSTPPESKDQEPSVPAALVSQASIPAAPVSQASVPAAPVSQASIPAAPVSQASIPAAPVSQASVPPAPVPQASVPQASVPQASVPQTSVPQTPVPETSAPVEPETSAPIELETSTSLVLSSRAAPDQPPLSVIEQTAPYGVTVEISPRNAQAAPASVTPEHFRTTDTPPSVSPITSSSGSTSADLLAKALSISSSVERTDMASPLSHHVWTDGLPPQDPPTPPALQKADPSLRVLPTVEKDPRSHSVLLRGLTYPDSSRRTSRNVEISWLLRRHKNRSLSYTEQCSERIFRKALQSLATRGTTRTGVGDLVEAFSGRTKHSSAVRFKSRTFKHLIGSALANNDSGSLPAIASKKRVEESEADDTSSEESEEIDVTQPYVWGVPAHHPSERPGNESLHSDVMLFDDTEETKQVLSSLPPVRSKKNNTLRMIDPKTLQLAIPPDPEPIHLVIDPVIPYGQATRYPPRRVPGPAGQSPDSYTLPKSDKKSGSSSQPTPQPIPLPKPPAGQQPKSQPPKSPPRQQPVEDSIPELTSDLSSESSGDELHDLRAGQTVARGSTLSINLLSKPSARYKSSIRASILNMTANSPGPPKSPTGSREHITPLDFVKNPDDKVQVRPKKWLWRRRYCPNCRTGFCSEHAMSKYCALIREIGGRKARSKTDNKADKATRDIIRWSQQPMVEFWPLFRYDIRSRALLQHPIPPTYRNQKHQGNQTIASYRATALQQMSRINLPDVGRMAPDNPPNEKEYQGDKPGDKDSLISRKNGIIKGIASLKAVDTLTPYQSTIPTHFPSLPVSKPVIRGPSLVLHHANASEHDGSDTSSSEYSDVSSISEPEKDNSPPSVNKHSEIVPPVKLQLIRNKARYESPAVVPHTKMPDKVQYIRKYKHEKIPLARMHSNIETAASLNGFKLIARAKTLDHSIMATASSGTAQQFGGLLTMVHSRLNDINGILKAKKHPAPKFQSKRTSSLEACSKPGLRYTRPKAYVSCKAVASNRISQAAKYSCIVQPLPPPPPISTQLKQMVVNPPPPAKNLRTVAFEQKDDVVSFTSTSDESSDDQTSDFDAEEMQSDEKAAARGSSTSIDSSASSCQSYTSQYTQGFCAFEKVIANPNRHMVHLDRQLIKAKQYKLNEPALARKILATLRTAVACTPFGILKRQFRADFQVKKILQYDAEIDAETASWTPILPLEMTKKHLTPPPAAPRLQPVPVLTDLKSVDLPPIVGQFAPPLYIGKPAPVPPVTLCQYTGELEDCIHQPVLDLDTHFGDYWYSRADVKDPIRPRRQGRGYKASVSLKRTPRSFAARSKTPATYKKDKEVGDPSLLTTLLHGVSHINSAAVFR